MACCANNANHFSRWSQVQGVKADLKGVRESDSMFYTV